MTERLIRSLPGANAHLPAHARVATRALAGTCAEQGRSDAMYTIFDYPQAGYPHLPL
ncbi:hypothetical protein [Rhodococcus sp. EPR-157]|uniref:hypothetical protein n=1 Tax=Rhodococcus sp. EPR-157 TaxID=1813677 RepID=UPI000ABB18AF|nr:hypothetical protein [Rhodococcus sp. EPR-157]